MNSKKETQEEYIDRIKRGTYAGIDEVGVSSIAGPMVASVVILPKEHGIPMLPRDSKEMSSGDMETIALLIKEKAVYYYTAQLNNNEINQLGSLMAREKLWQQCAHKVRESYPNIRIVVDGRDKIPNLERQSAVSKGDTIFDAVSAAAIISKQFCDEQMVRLHQLFPKYNFHKNKGYPVPEHYRALKEYGLCPAHRASMATDFMNTPPEITEANLCMDELTKLLQDTAILLSKNRSLARDEFEYPFMRKMYTKVILNHNVPSPKEQYYILRTTTHIKKRAERLLGKNAP